MNKYNRFIRKLGNFSYVLSAAMMIAALLINLIPPATVFASAGAIWTTASTCAAPDPQDQNLYKTGDTVYVRGHNFDPNKDFVWVITQPGHSGVIETGTGKTDSTGYFCLTGHKILPGESGTYSVNVTATGDSTKNDNYRVNDTSSGLVLTKTGVLDLVNGILNPGDHIDYTLTVTNNGTSALKNIVVTDTLLVSVICQGGSNEINQLNSGASKTCSGVHVITQAEIDAGFVYNLATAQSGDVPPKFPPAYADVTIDLPTTHSLSLVKSGVLDLGNGVLNAGDVINYSLVVTNTGNATLTNVTVSDPLMVTIVCPGGNGTLSLNPGAFVTCTGSYAITQLDIDAGLRANTASATSDQAGPETDSFNVPLTAPSAISLSKTGVLDKGGDGVLNEGDVINYSLVVTNTGNATLTNVTVSDPLLTTIVCLGGNGTFSLDPGAFVTCTGSYTILQSDITAGHRANTASATSDQAGPVDASFNVPLTANPPDTVTICYNGVTMTVPVADLGQYPGYVLGACLPPPPPPRPEDPVSVTRDCAGFTLHNGNAWLVNGSWEIEGTDLSGKFSLGAKESVTINTGFQTGDLLVNHGDHAFRVAAYTACGEILIPVTGMDTGAAGRFGSQYLFLASIAFFGFGLMLNGYARKHEEEDL